MSSSPTITHRVSMSASRVTDPVSMHSPQYIPRSNTLRTTNPEARHQELFNSRQQSSYTPQHTTREYGPNPAYRNPYIFPNVAINSNDDDNDEEDKDEENLPPLVTTATTADTEDQIDALLNLLRTVQRLEDEEQQFGIAVRNARATINQISEFVDAFEDQGHEDNFLSLQEFLDEERVGAWRSDDDQQTTWNRHRGDGSGMTGSYVLPFEHVSSDAVVRIPTGYQFPLRQLGDDSLDVDENLGRADLDNFHSAMTALRIVYQNRPNQALLDNEDESEEEFDGARNVTRGGVPLFFEDGEASILENWLITQPIIDRNGDQVASTIEAIDSGVGFVTPEGDGGLNLLWRSVDGNGNIRVNADGNKHVEIIEVITGSDKKLCGCGLRECQSCRALGARGTRNYRTSS